VRRLIWYLKETSPRVNSLLERSVPEWELSIRTYFVEKGKWRGRVQRYIDASGTPREAQRNDPVLYALKLISETIQDAYDALDGISEFEQDVWDVRKLGYAPSPGTNKYQLNFTEVRPLWLKQAAKSFCRYWLTERTRGDCENKLKAVRDLGRFLHKTRPECKPQDVGREILLEYLSALTARRLAASTRRGMISSLRVFCETCSEENWAAFPWEFEVFDDDLPRVPKRDPRHLEEDVLQQLTSNLDGLPTHFARMLVIQLDLGLRISEALTLRTDCLSQDTTGEWTLHYYQHKVKRQHQAPLSKDVAALIQQQVEDVRVQFGEGERLLFPSTGKGPKWKGKPYNENAVVDALNRLCYDRNIRDVSGRHVHITTHQFRHTVGAGLVNRGVPITVI
jgi:integrase